MELNKAYIIQTLQEEHLWKTGESDTFTFNEWELTLRKEDKIYLPYTFAIIGKKKNSNETINRRYKSVEKAFLHILNHFNENINVQNRYRKLDDVFSDKLSEIK